MNKSDQPIDKQQDIMINIQLSDGCFEVNQELVPLVQNASLALGLSDVKDLKTILEEQFFTVLFR